MNDSSELQPIVEFLGRHAPYAGLDAVAREQLARQLSIEYARRGTHMRPDTVQDPRVYLVRSGAIRECDEGGVLLAHHGEGDTFGMALSPKGASSGGQVPRWEAMEDSLLYSVVGSRFAELCSRWPRLAAFFEGQRVGLAQGEALSRNREDTVAGSALAAHADALSTRIASLLRGTVVHVSANESIRTAARRMSDARVSSVIVVDSSGDGPGAAGRPLGIVTDRDLRNRVVAEGRSTDAPVHTIMSAPVISVSPEASLLQALVIMVDHSVHHLVVLDEHEPVGVVTLTDWMRARAQNPVYLLNDIQRQTDVAGLAAISAQRSRVLVHLMEAGIGPREVHAVLTTLQDAITRRLIALASRELRAEGLELPSQGWCWVSFGSQARQEGALGSDQDNGLVLADEPAGYEPHFRALGERVCRGLDACGYPFCRGGIMASEAECRKSLRAWEDDFRRWIAEPSRDAVMRGAIFFDMRAIDGDEQLVSTLRTRVAEAVVERPLFVAHLARDALVRRPPLGFFRQLVVEPSGEHAETLDVKRRGVMPIVDLARTYALESGCAEPETRRRLEWARRRGTLSDRGFEELSEALEVIQRERLRHQVRCVTGERPIDNHLRPAELSGAERRQLRDAFRVVRTLQQNLEHSRQLGNLSG